MIISRNILWSKEPNWVPKYHNALIAPRSSIRRALEQQTKGFDFGSLYGQQDLTACLVSIYNLLKPKVAASVCTWVDYDLLWNFYTNIPSTLFLRFIWSSLYFVHLQDRQFGDIFSKVWYSIKYEVCFTITLTLVSIVHVISISEIRLSSYKTGKAKEICGFRNVSTNTISIYCPCLPIQYC
jgi:hypothetical protein